MRRRGIENYRLTVALGGNAANFDEPLPCDDSYANALSLYLSSSGDRETRARGDPTQKHRRATGCPKAIVEWRRARGHNIDMLVGTRQE